MKNNSKKWLIIFGICVAIVFLVGIGILTLPSANQNTEAPTYITDPPEEILDPNAPDFKSPYNAEESYIGTLVPVWNKHLVFENTTITTTTNSDTLYAVSLDVEDVISIRLPRQHLNTDITKAKIVFVLHEQMKDPYTTTPAQYTPFCEGTFKQQEDGTWLSQVMLGYDDDIKNHVDMLYIYDGEIEGFSMFRISQNYKNSKAYYQWLRPEATVCTMQFVAPDMMFTYYYYADEVTKLVDWIDTATNSAQWILQDGALMSSDAEWFIESKHMNTTLSDGIQIPLTSINDHQHPSNPYQFETANPNFLVYWLGKNAAHIAAQFGEASNITTFSNITRMEYPTLIFYVHDTDGVVQIDAKPGTTNIINGLPFDAMNAMEIFKECRHKNIAYTTINNKVAENNFYIYHLPIKVGDYTVSYVWEGETQSNPNHDEFTRIVIYTGEEYIY